MNTSSCRLWYFLFLCLFLAACSRPKGAYAPSPGTRHEHFHLTITQQNSAYAYSQSAEIEDDSLTVFFVGELVGERPRPLWSTHLDQSVQDSLQRYLSLPAIDTLARLYDSQVAMDGLVIAYTILTDGKEKKVQLVNQWVEPLLGLTRLVNRLLPDKYRFVLEVPKAKTG